jgi:DNA-binding transcriptional MerR regulator
VPVSEPRFTTTQVTQLTDLKRHELAVWARAGALRPSVKDSKGPGGLRLYNNWDIAAALVVQALHRAGVRLALLKPIIEKIQAGTYAEAVDGDVALMLPDGRWVHGQYKDVKALLEDRPAGHIVDLARVRLEAGAYLAHGELLVPPEPSGTKK